MKTVGLLLSLLLLSSIKSNGQSAQYATAGSGSMRNYISWFDWAGVSITNNSTTNFTTADGMNVTVKLTGVSGPPVLPSVMNTWWGAVLWKLYDFTDPLVKPALFSYNTPPSVDPALNRVSFTMEITATRSGIPTPFTLVAVDAEGSDASETTTFTTDGTAWRTIEFFRNSSQTNNPLVGCGTKTVNLSLTYGDAPETGQNPVLATDGNSSLKVTTTMNRTGGGGMAVAFGIFSPIDRGDLPASYSHAHHGLTFTTNNSCNFNPPYPSISQASNLNLGLLPGDADGAQTLNDNAWGADEDAVTLFSLYNGSGSYTVPVSLKNNSGSSAVLKGWFDYNRDGSFSNNESVSLIIPNGATSTNLTWTGLPATLVPGSVSGFAFRFRLASVANEVQDPGGYAKDGEIEDYLISQNVVAPQSTTAFPSFTIPDTVCVNTPVNIVNTSTGATNYFWNFCVADMNVAPSGENLGNIGSSFSAPVFMDYAFFNGNYYGFVVNHSPGGLVRLDFGNSLLNTPTRVSLGNFGGIIPTGPGAEGIQIVFNEGSWHAIIVGGYVPSGSTPRILKLEFGANLNNPSPVATNWGNLGNMSQPIDLHVFKEGNNWYGFTVNSENNSITRFDFTASFSNTPTAVNLGNIGNLSYPTGIYAINDNGFWRVFVTNAGDNTRETLNASLTRLDFGTSLLNTPTGTNLGNPGNILQHPRDLTIMKMCDQIVGFAVNGHLDNSNIIKLNFNNNLSSIPTMTSLGVIGNSSFPHSISKLFRVNNDLYSFITNVDNNTITRLRFTGCSNSSIANSSLQNPPAVTYNAPGIYSINLTVDDGLPTQATFCKQVVVMSLTHSATKNFSVCSGGALKIGSSIKPATYLWSTGATTDSIEVNTTGIYWVESSRYGCKVRDSFNITAGPSSIDFGFQQNLCNPLTIQFTSALPGVQSYEWDFGNGQTNTSSQLPVISYDSYGNYNISLKAVFGNGCTGTVNKTINLSNFSDYDLILNNDTTICLGDSILIKTASLGLGYCWQASPSSAPSSVNGYIKPTSSSIYKLTSQVASANMVDNGDFSAGNTGFSSQYNYAFPNLAEGQYWVGSTPVSWNGGVSNCTDHSTGNGQMMTVNGSPLANAKVWSQSIAVTPNTNYNFSIWIQSLSSANPANLQFSINNINLGNSIISNSTTCQWKQYSSGWNSGNSTTAVITIVNNNTVAAGNDFALDDIYFGQVITKTDSVNVTVVGLCDSVKLSGINKVCSSSDTLTYNIYKSAACTQQYALQVDNSFATIVSQTPTSVRLVFKKEGRTTIGVSYANDCKMVVDSLPVDIKFSPSLVSLGPDIITCRDTSVQLNAGTGFDSYLWNNGSTDSVITASVSGVYSVAAKNLCGIQLKDSFQIVRVTPIPFAVSPANVILCKPDSLQFTASGGNSYSWQPSSLFNQPAAGSTKAFINSSQAFSIAISDALCRRDTLISIPVQLLPPPKITLSKSNDVTCENDSAILIASGGVSYSWSPNIYIARTAYGRITVKPPKTQTYVVTGKDASGCQGVDSVKVSFINTGNQKLFMPTAFTPDGDGINETFRPTFIGPANKYEFRIYNRWGQLIFKSTVPGVGWNGMYNSIKQPNDVYVYYITAEGFCNGKFEKKGTFVLIK